jgi:hypothetical protein
LIETVMDDDERGAVDKVEQIFDLLTSPAAAWLAGKTQREVHIEHPYYVLFLYRSGEGYTNEAGSPDLADITARAKRGIAQGARTAYVTQVIETFQHP